MRQRNNIVISGIRSSEGTKAEVVEDWLKEKLELNIEIKVKSEWSIGDKKPKLGVTLDSRDGEEEVKENESKLANL